MRINKEEDELSNEFKRLVDIVQERPCDVLSDFFACLKNEIAEDYSFQVYDKNVESIYNSFIQKINEFSTECFETCPPRLDKKLIQQLEAIIKVIEVKLTDQRRSTKKRLKNETLELNKISSIKNLIHASICEIMRAVFGNKSILYLSCKMITNITHKRSAYGMLICVKDEYLVKHLIK